MIYALHFIASSHALYVNKPYKTLNDSSTAYPTFFPVHAKIFVASNYWRIIRAVYALARSKHAHMHTWGQKEDDPKVKRARESRNESECPWKRERGEKQSGFSRARSFQTAKRSKREPRVSTSAHPRRCHRVTRVCVPNKQPSNLRASSSGRPRFPVEGTRCRRERPPAESFCSLSLCYVPMCVIQHNARDATARKNVYEESQRRRRLVLELERYYF